jgi:S1-C subfamily serine protease
MDPKELTAAEAYKATVGAVTVIITDSGIGTGFIIGSEGIVLTNSHVVGSAAAVAVKGVYSDGKQFHLSGSVLSRNVERDIALVRLMGLSGPLSCVSLHRSGEIDPGADVVVIGNPGVVEGISVNNITKGIVSNPNLTIPDFGTLILIDAAVNPGNSGGPVINLMTGEVIGMVTFGFSRNPRAQGIIREGQGGVIPFGMLWAELKSVATLGKCHD